MGKNKKKNKGKKERGFEWDSDMTASTPSSNTDTTNSNTNTERDNSSLGGQASAGATQCQDPMMSMLQQMLGKMTSMESRLDKVDKIEKRLDSISQDVEGLKKPKALLSVLTQPQTSIKTSKNCPEAMEVDSQAQMVFGNAKTEQLMSATRQITQSQPQMTFDDFLRIVTNSQMQVTNQQSYDAHNYSDGDKEWKKPVHVTPGEEAYEKLLTEFGQLQSDSSKYSNYTCNAVRSTVSHVQSRLSGDRNPSLKVLKQMCDEVVQARETLMERVTFIQSYTEEGFQYVGHGDSDLLDRIIRYQPEREIYLFFFNFSKRNERAEIWQFFRHLLAYKDSNKDSVFVLVDNEIRVPKGTEENELIKKYQSGNLVCDDVMTDLKQLDNLCLARVPKLDRDKPKPTKKTYFETACPMWFTDKGKTCTKDKVNWQCMSCFQQLEYGFDDYLHCNCGAGLVVNYTFRCNGTKHGKVFIEFPKDVVPGLVGNLKSFDGLTILILGETGVGKSTFINGFANYLQFQTLEEAKESDRLISPVKSSFIITDEDFQLQTITTGEEENECHVVGQSATQGTRAHVFNYKGSTDVRLIDTPGIGDTRGIEQDKENFQNILAYISYYEEIHGICILLKPNNSRLTVMFEFCIKELLTHLHKSAAENIIFCFTNARSTNYRPGDTYPALKKLLDVTRRVPIELKKETVYCMDNESFRYLAAIKHGVGFGSEEDKIFSASWDKARSETDRLMEFVSTLQPHRVKETISVNDVRRRILDLTKPLAEIAKHIEITISNFEDQKNEISNSQASAEDLKKMINIQIPTLERQSLNHPRTVCTSITCAETHQLDGKSVKNFTVRCHPHCRLDGVQADTINNPDLKGCWAMSPGGEQCHVCGCKWNTHMHVTYEMIAVTKPGEDQDAKKRYQGITDRIQLKKKMADDLEAKKLELEDEKTAILKACAQFGIFLKNNSVLVYNDAMIGYLNLMIKQAREKVDETQDYTFVDSLSQLKIRYEQEIEVIKNATESDHELEHDPEANAIDQNAALQDLFKLKHYGDNMRRLLNEMEREKVAKVTFEENRSYMVASSKTSMLKKITVRCQTLANFVFMFPGRTLLPLLGFSGTTDFRKRNAIEMEEGRGNRSEKDALEDGLFSSGNEQTSVRDGRIEYGRWVNERNCQFLR